ncbi:hypothetical protein RA21_16045 [Leisingera sp. ANG-DT]|nr:hypothetical protein RA21_16045 [Leisingera sp. ANG-DT]
MAPGSDVSPKIAIFAIGLQYKLKSAVDQFGRLVCRTLPTGSFGWLLALGFLVLRKKANTTLNSGSLLLISASQVGIQANLDQTPNSFIF